MFDGSFFLPPRQPEYEPEPPPITIILNEEPPKPRLGFWSTFWLVFILAIVIF